ncbi:MAG: hypothetical protein LH654_02155 [Thermoleophilia bacterium]|nr:hypothetical protein [Thermoleophilia bacterium]
MRFAWRVLQLLLLPTVGLVVAFALAPDRVELETHIWLLVVLGLSLVALLRVIHKAYPSSTSPFLASLTRPVVRVERPAPLTRIERSVSMAEASAFDVHYRLRPILVELAGELLAARRGIDLKSDPDACRALVGEDAWELIRPGRPDPKDRLADGISANALERVVASLERV